MLALRVGNPVEWDTMSDDMAERLRNHPIDAGAETDDLLGDAADEIDRLTKLVADMAFDLDRLRNPT